MLLYQIPPLKAYLWCTMHPILAYALSINNSPPIPLPMYCFHMPENRQQSSEYFQNIFIFNKIKKKSDIYSTFLPTDYVYYNTCILGHIFCFFTLGRKKPQARLKIEVGLKSWPPRPAPASPQPSLRGVLWRTELYQFVNSDNLRNIIVFYISGRNYQQKSAKADMRRKSSGYI